MVNKLIIKRCRNCGATIEILKDCNCENCGITCCGEQMELVKPNSADASHEKHLPKYEIVGDFVLVSVPHVMEDKHYIEFIGIQSNDFSAKKYLKPNESPKCIFPYIPGATLSIYCNLHGLWETHLK